jgi:hypothetical protein
MNLIFIEGVSGAGKSTLAKKLCDRLRGGRLSVDCYIEGDFSNPIDFYCAAYFKQDEYADLLLKYRDFSNDIKRNTIFAEDVRLVRYYNGTTTLFPEPLLDALRQREFSWKPIDPVPIAEYTHVYKSVWEQFAKNESVYSGYQIFDGTLLHHPINDMSRNYNASREQIINHVNTLIEVVRRLSPRIIYLSSDDVAERLQKARISRKEPPPTAKQIRFWEERKQMDFAVLKQLSIPYDICDISRENWDSTAIRAALSIGAPVYP